MPRKPRIHSPVDYYHVMMRGNNKEGIFNSKDLKNYFLECIKEQDKDIGVAIAAYCIMDNHVHLLIKSDLDNLAKYTSKINTKYAMKYNYIKDRKGHVFQDRFKSEAISDETYLLNVVRYIHNNPVKAKIVNYPNEYKWSSYNEIVYKNEIVCSDQKKFLNEIFVTKDRFRDFHNIVDTNEYLDTSEDIEEFKLDTAQLIISKYFKDKGINHIYEIKNHYNHYEELVKMLIINTTLSNRQIASLLCVDRGMVNETKNKLLPPGTVPIGS